MIKLITKKAPIKEMSAQASGVIFYLQIIVWLCVIQQFNVASDFYNMTI